ncbi:SMP-30/gluconolactonase/LRE family protein [Tabrizicola sp. BL-A-41-H6]|uniref:SMP-30/gluconolactonase/LRE family protein n=1 Tax=Tabrizicola sp. BL-A-41-H6 TaxID=3421107 RepID=UPI003D679A70
MTARLIFDAQDMVGESLLWDDRRGRLVWIDIIGRRVHALDPVTGDHRLWPLPFRPTSISLREDGDAMLCSERHICRWNWQGEPVPLIEVEPDLPMNRLNEGAVGPDGALWVGSMHQNIGDDDSPKDIPGATGHIYRFAPDGHLRQMADDLYGIANTLVWPEPDLLVVADTLQNTLYQYRIGPDGLGPRAVFAAGLERGLPDGSTTDAAGRVWNARVVGGYALACLETDGRLAAYHDLPCSWPTSCAFGGAGLDRLFVTSARFTMNAEHLQTAPQEGGLFEVATTARGKPPNRFGQM